MEENVALDATKQRKFVKSIKGIKKLVKENDSVKANDAVSLKDKDGKGKRKRPDRGLVYLSHIPHGFYEYEMSQYFKQFGLVTNVRVIRSKRTGNSKGFAFVEFKEPAVAEIVAETMNNYLMGKRLIKAAYVPPEKQRYKAMRKHWTSLNNPGREARLKNKKAYNENKDDAGELKRARKIISNLNKTKKRLVEFGINYDFFTPVDVPEGLQKSLKAKDNEDINNVVKGERKSKNDKKLQQIESKDTKESLKKDKNTKEREIKLEKNKKSQNAETKDTVVKNEQKKSDNTKGNKKNKEEPVINKKEQKKKQQKLKEAGVNPPENFIKVQEETEDSDSSLEFDSDEYEKMLEDEGSDIDSGDDDDDVASDGGSEDDDASEEGESEADVEEITPPIKKSKGKSTPVITQVPKQGTKQKTKAPEQVKRKVPHKSPVSPKKPKFEKQTHQPMKKQFKKKK